MAKSQRYRQFRKSNKVWDAPVLAPAAGFVAGMLLALAVAELEETTRALTAFGHEDSLAPLWAFFFGFFSVGLVVLAVQKATHRVIRELRAYINIRPFTGARLLGADLWAMDAVFGESLIQLVDEGPEHLVELGSGHSTLLMADRMEENGAGHIVALEHLDWIAERSRSWLRDEGLDHRATVVHAPLVECEIDGRTYRWYDLETAADFLPERIDALVVDGPPAKMGKDMRWPAVPLLEDRLGPEVVILMDDGDRAEERRAAFDWAQRLGGWARYVPGGKGGWIVRTGE